MSVSEARSTSSGRLRKRPRISYKEPDDEDLDIVDDVKEEVLSRKRPGRIDKRRIFRWAELPAELRNRIYDLCLSRKSPLLICRVIIGRKKYSPYIIRTSTAMQLIPNILLASKATFAEGNPILYQNQFHFECPQIMYLFLSSLSATSKSWVKGVTLGGLSTGCYYSGMTSDFGSGYLLPALDSLIGTNRLKYLQLDIIGIEVASERELTRFARRFLQMCQKWMHAVGKGKGDKMALLDLIVLKDKGDGKRWPDACYDGNFFMDEWWKEEREKKKAQHDIQTLRLRQELKKWIA